MKEKGPCVNSQEDVGILGRGYVSDCFGSSTAVLAQGDGEAFLALVP